MLRPLLALLLCATLAIAQEAPPAEAPPAEAPPAEAPPAEAPVPAPPPPAETELPERPPAPAEPPAPGRGGPSEELIAPPPEDEEEDLGSETIIGGSSDRLRAAGSAAQIDAEQLERFEYDDLNRVLRNVPGVYIREEDGFGLRPNIGIRGVNPDRSSKVVLMEDGVLFGPAPYSAPAAYYFPITTRIHQIEVFKGPSAIKYGPNTIGGAINLVTRPIPAKLSGGVDIAGGSFKYRKAHAWIGASNDFAGFQVEGVTLGSDGFKEVDDGGNTGFVKNEGQVKFRLNTDPTETVVHQLDVKLGAANEVSQESYLGVSDFDFRLDPYRRYVASRRDRFDWVRTQAQVGYTAFIGEGIELQVQAYRHDFSRDWRRLNRFKDGPDLRDILANPTTPQNAVFFQVLTGQQDTATDGQTLQVTSNDRRFISQGVQGRATFRFETGEVEHELEVGVRVHDDEIRRFHTEEGFLIRSGALVGDGLPVVATTRNTAEARAYAFYLAEKLTWGKLTVTPGLRVEHIRTDFRDHLNGRTERADDTVFLPGIGAFFEVTDGFGVLAGVHRGFSPVAPGNDESVDPELSINSEAGFRLWGEAFEFETIGFFNHYSELISDATFSSGATNAQLGQQFNGGEVNIYGIESSGRYDLLTDFAVNFRFMATYTFTVSEFLDSFVSSDPTFGTVQEGDRLPYLPRHQGSATVGAFGDVWGVYLSYTYVGRFTEMAARRNIPESEEIDAYDYFDAAAQVTFLDMHTVYLRVDNILDDVYLVSRRPFGARPGKRRTFIIGYKFEF